MQQPSKSRTEDTMDGGGDVEQGIKTANGGLQTLAWHVHLCAAPARGGSGLLRLLGMGGEQHPILTDVAGETHAGQCTAVLGPSGCGKTTLLECIALRRRGFAGSIYVDGQFATPAYLQRMSFVHQADVFFPHLTVREHLIFHATTRAAASANPHQPGQDESESKEEEAEATKSMDEVVAAAIRQVGLGKCADTLIGGIIGNGSAASHHSGISGGERKRLAIATELLSNPRILILDEPTTGLDSNMGTLICRLLRNLTKSKGDEHGRMVLASIHGPSGRMLSCFTHLLVLTDHGGRVAYHGPTQDAEAFFTAALGGKSRPSDFNAAEFLLNSVSDLCVDSDGTSSNTSDLLVHSDDPARVAAAFDQLQLSHKVALPVATSHARPTLCGKSARRVSLFTLFKANLWRLGLEVGRTPGLSLVLAANGMIMGGMFGFLYYQQVVESWRNTMCMVFALMVCMVVLTLGHASPHIPSQWPLLVREQQVGANSAGPFFLALSLADLPRLLLISCCCILPFFLAGLHTIPDAASFFGQFFLLHFLMVVGASSIAYLGAACSGAPVVGFVIAVTIGTPMVLLSGLLYQRSKINGGFLHFLANTSMMNYAYGGTIDAFCREQPYSGNCKFILGFLEVRKGEYDRDLVRLVILIIGFRLLAYVFLSARLHLVR